MLKPIYIAGKRLFPNVNGVYKLKLGSAVEARVLNGLAAPDFRAEIDVFGENVLLDYRKTAEAAALLVTRKLRQILKSLKGIDDGTKPQAEEPRPSTDKVPDKRGIHPSRRRAVPT